MPTASGLAESNYTLMQPLEPSTGYRWQVVAVNDAGASAGDEWSFTTKSILPGDINNDGNVNLADAILALKIIAGMDTDQTVCKIADVNGDGKIGLSEVIYILQKMSGLRQ